MKTHKYSSILIAIILVAPVPVFAAWWNPFTWKIFSSHTEPTPIVATTTIQIASTTTNRQSDMTSTSTSIRETASTSDAGEKPTDSVTEFSSQTAQQSYPLPPIISKPVQHTPTITNASDIVLPPTQDRLNMVIATCNSSLQLMKLCQENNVIQLYSSNLNFRATFDDMISQLEKTKRVQYEHALKEVGIPIYVPSYHVKLPSTQEQNQNDFNRQICTDLGGVYMASKCIH